MISNQILQNTIDGLKNITRRELSVVEREGKIVATTEEDMVNAVKWMLQDGLKITQIAIVGSAMISCDPLDPDLVKKVLKSPEIKNFQEELKAKSVVAKAK